MLVAVNAAAVMANTNLSNLERNQIAQDLLLQERIGVNSRDIAGVNTELSRIYIEFKGRLDNHVGRIGTLETKMTTAEGRINSAFEYLTDYGALINNLFDQILRAYNRNMSCVLCCKTSHSHKISMNRYHYLIF